MNVKEIMIECGTYIAPENIDVTYKEIEFLCEHIIRKCASVADDNYNKGFCPVGGYIKEYFGIDK